MVFSYSAVFACHFSTLAINKGWPHSHLEQAFPSDYRSGILGSFIRRSLFISASLSDVKFSSEFTGSLRCLLCFLFCLGKIDIVLTWLLKQNNLLA